MVALFFLCVPLRSPRLDCSGPHPTAEDAEARRDEKAGMCIGHNARKRSDHDSIRTNARLFTKRGRRRGLKGWRKSLIRCELKFLTCNDFRGEGEPPEVLALNPNLHS